MIRFPRNHVADETMARVMVAAKRVRTRREGPELEPEDDELVDLPPSLMPITPPRAGSRGASGTEAEAEQNAPPSSGDVPPLDESGLDQGLILHGADSFDALFKT